MKETKRIADLQRSLEEAMSRLSSENQGLDVQEAKILLENAKKNISVLREEIHRLKAALACTQQTEIECESSSSLSNLTSSPVAGAMSVKSSPQSSSLMGSSSSPAAVGAAAALVKDTKFFKSLSSDFGRHFVIIVDKSASMKLGDRWKQAEETVKVLSEKACERDTDGISLYFFSSQTKTALGEVMAFNKYDSVTSEETVMELFNAKENKPHGGTDLTKVLTDALSKSVSNKVSKLCLN